MRQALGACESAGVPVLSGLRKGVAELFEIEIKVGEHGEPAVAIPIAKLAERLMDLGTSTFWRYRLKPLYSTIDHYMAASPARIAHVIHKHFHHRVGDRERTLGTSYSKRVADLLGAM